MSQPQLQTLKGFRDFLPAAKRNRDYVMGKLIETFKTFGFEPLETPTLEYASLLLGKYGDEADKLVYTFTDQGDRRVGLRYDQTVPTARVLSQYQNDLPKYFRRYQTQNVFRADKPQKGRYREFQQCDIDIFGTTSPLADAEILACTYAAFHNVGFATTELCVNDRQLLFALLEPFATPEVSVFSLIQSIDKLDKLSPQEVAGELVSKGLDQATAEKALRQLENTAPSAYLQEIVAAAEKLGVPASALKFTPSLARGLDYYTGMIFEVKLPEYAVGSCGGGGRYDNLIAQLGGQATPAVGMAFGFDRVVEAAETLGLIPSAIASCQIMVTQFAETQTNSLQLAAQLRAAGIATELYPEPDKLGKQFKLADQKKIPYVAILGEAEVAAGMVMLKNMATGEQEAMDVSTLIKKV
jgi:histidyl-tRNA synthetase